MKKLFFILLVCLVPCSAYATATAEAIVETRVLSADGSVVELRYAPDSCAASTSCEYALATASIKGKLLNWRFESASTDADLWFANSTGEAITGFDTIASYAGIGTGVGCNLGCAADTSTLPVDFFNDDATPAKKLYFHIKNDDPSHATGSSGVLIIEVQRGDY